MDQKFNIITLTRVLFKNVLRLPKWVSRREEKFTFRLKNICQLSFRYIKKKEVHGTDVIF